MVKEPCCSGAGAPELPTSAPVRRYAPCTMCGGGTYHCRMGERTIHITSSDYSLKELWSIPHQVPNTPLNAQLHFARHSE